MDDETKNYIIEKFGRIHPVFEHMEKYNPEILKGFITIRKATLPPKGVASAVPEKMKELIVIAVEVALGRGEKGKSHARRAVRLGATPQEVHETVSLVIWLAGWATYVDGGMDAVKAAEDEYEKMLKGEPFFWTQELSTDKKAH